MPYRSKCPGCGQAFTAPDALAGKSVKCPNCGAKLAIPPLTEPVAEPTVPASPVMLTPVWKPEIPGSPSMPTPAAKVAARDPQAEPMLGNLTSDPDDLFKDALGPKSPGAGSADYELESPRSGPLTTAAPSAPRPASGPPWQQILALVGPFMLRHLAIVLLILMIAYNVVAYFGRGLPIIVGFFAIVGVLAILACLSLKPLAVVTEYCAERRASFASGFVITLALGKGIGKAAEKLDYSPPPYWLHPLNLFFVVLGVIFVISVIGLILSFLVVHRKRGAEVAKGLVVGLYGLLTIVVVMLERPIVGQINVAEQTALENQLAVENFQLPDLPPLQPVAGRPGILTAEVQFSTREDSPGSGMRLMVYLPAGEHADHSVPCVLVGAAGSTGFAGVKLDAEEALPFLPYVEAGFALVAFDIDGAPKDDTDQQYIAAYKKYLAANGGLFNADIALRFALDRLPQVDPARLIAAGHSSAASLALVWGAREPRIAAVVALAPVYDLRVLKRDAVKQFSQMPRHFPGLSDFVDMMSPARYVEKLDRPTFVLHAEDDNVVPFPTAETFTKEMQSSHKDFHFEAPKTGGHAAGLLSPGVSQAIVWLDGVKLGTPATAQLRTQREQAAAVAAEPAPQQPTAKFPTSEELQAAHNAKIEEQRRTIEESRAAYAARANAYSLAKLPRANSAERFMQLAYIDYVLGTDDLAARRMRQTRSGKRLKLFSRWGVGLSMVNKKAQTTVHHAMDLRGDTGPIGEGIVTGLKQRVGDRRFGEWPLFSARFFENPELNFGAKQELIEASRSNGLDALVVLEVDSKISGLNRRKSSTIVAHVIDLTGNIPDWESKPLASKDANQATTGLFRDSVLKHIDENYMLDPADDRDAKAVRERVKDMIWQHGENASRLNPLEVVCELRYYLAKKLLTPAEASEACDALFGEGKGAKLLEGPWENRMAALEQLKLP